MSKILCYHNGKYNFYSTISDGFCYVKALSLGQVCAVIDYEEGENGLVKLPERLERAHKHGHSALSEESLEDFLCCNRAGDNEEKLTYQECIDRFLS